jgi:Ca2+/Na+ antiporter
MVMACTVLFVIMGTHEFSHNESTGGFHMAFQRKLSQADNVTSDVPAEGCRSATPTEEGALSGYPKTPFTMEQYEAGAIVFPICIILYMFYGLAIACDKYFQPALEAICENLHLGDDVAGATFMAAGGSAPELATSLLGVFVSKSDIGIGTIVGSAVFNVLFVIAACALLAPNLEVTWYPLGRDCIYYCMSILALTIVVLDQKVQWYEACMLFLLYIIYCTIMNFNASVHRCVEDFVKNSEKRKPNRVQTFIIAANGPASILIYAVIIVNIAVMLGYDENEYPAAGILNHVCAVFFVCEFLIKNYGFGIVGYWKSAPDAFDGVLVSLIGVEYIIAGSGGGTMAVFRGLKFVRFLRFLRVLRILRLISVWTKEVKDASTQTGEVEAAYEAVAEAPVPTPTGLAPILPEQAVTTTELVITAPPGGANGVGPSTRLPGAVPSDGGDVTPPTRTEIQPSPVTLGKETDILPKTYVGDTGGSSVAEKSAVTDGTEEDDDAVAAEGSEGDGEEDDGPFDPFDRGEGVIDMLIWLVTIPLVIVIYLTIPDCKNPRFAKCWPLTFFLCIVWIAALAYVMVWMATVFGVVAGIPDPVMGLTLLAAGTSIPDALSSLAVARKGHGDMAVSSSVGSNIFDILIGLPVPWMLYSAVNEGETIPICSSSLGIMIITLFVMVALVVCSFNICKWRLTKRLGYGFLVLYFLFVFESLLLEYDVILAE